MAATEFNRMIRSLRTAAELLVPVAIDAEKDQIERRTAKGLDADNKKFPSWRNFNKSSKQVQPWTYSPAQSKKRAAEGLPTDIKTISFSGGTLASMGRYGDWLTVDDDHMPIMEGQMQHPRWKYHHNVLGVYDREDIPVMKQAIVKMLEVHLG